MNAAYRTAVCPQGSWRPAARPRVIVNHAAIELRESIIVVANYLRKKLLEPLEEQKRAEARARVSAEEHAKVLAEGFTEYLAEGLAKERARGRMEGRAETNVRWRLWNERRMAAESKGEPFDEPPPDVW